MQPRAISLAISVSTALFFVHGCTASVEKPARAAAAVAPLRPATVLHAAGNGTASARVRNLWEMTQPAVQADLDAGLTDAELQRRLPGIDEAWAQLQIDYAGADDARTKQVYRTVLAVRVYLASVYGGKDDPSEIRRRIQNDRAYQKVMRALAEDQIKALP